MAEPSSSVFRPMASIISSLASPCMRAATLHAKRMCHADQRSMEPAGPKRVQENSHLDWTAAGTAHQKILRLLAPESLVV